MAWFSKTHSSRISNTRCDVRKLYSQVTESSLYLSPSATVHNCRSPGVRGHLTDIPNLEQAQFQPDSKPRHMGEELLCSG